jgi:hypothetical protein
MARLKAEWHYRSNDPRAWPWWRRDEGELRKMLSEGGDHRELTAVPQESDL